MTHLTTFVLHSSLFIRAHSWPLQPSPAPSANYVLQKSAHLTTFVLHSSLFIRAHS